MARSGETFGKKEKEKNRAKHRQDKAEKMEERRANAKKGKSLDEMMAYIDENGNLSSVPPDPKKRMNFKQEDIQIGVPKRSDEENDIIRTGTVTFFNDDKGYGFIKDEQTGERIFIHVNQAGPLKEGDKVSYEVETGPKGFSAVKVQKV